MLSLRVKIYARGMFYGLGLYLQGRLVPIGLYLQGALYADGDVGLIAHTKCHTLPDNALLSVGSERESQRHLQLQDIGYGFPNAG